MAVPELESFVKKFHQLWSAGLSAHLDLDANDGRAWVGLRVQLGHAPGYLHQHLHPSYDQAYRKPDSRSRQRRRVKRAAAQQKKTEEALIQETI